MRLYSVMLSSALISVLINKAREIKKRRREIFIAPYKFFIAQEMHCATT